LNLLFDFSKTQTLRHNEWEVKSMIEEEDWEEDEDLDEEDEDEEW
jgi:hypothetical protein